MPKPINTDELDRIFPDSTNTIRPNPASIADLLARTVDTMAKQFNWHGRTGLPLTWADFTFITVLSVPLMGPATEQMVFRYAETDPLYKMDTTRAIVGLLPGAVAAAELEYFARTGEEE